MFPCKLNPHYRLLAPTVIATVQTLALVGGHVVGVFAAHACATKLFGARGATRSQLPVLGLMVLYTVTGLLLLFNA